MGKIPRQPLRERYLATEHNFFSLIKFLLAENVNSQLNLREILI